ncbi:ATP-binding protein [Aestuariivirga sp.]|uniref:ATP-binding protein n=1 Tax=Aestuariivirga sp. TaxID=2650926 RepID=UPI0039E3D29E
MPGAGEFLEALPDGALVLVAGGTITAANAQAEDMLQLRLTGLNAFTVIRLPAFVEAVQKCEQQNTAQTVELDIHSRPPRLLEAHVAPLGEGGSMLVVLRDLTREQQIERMRSDFVANASHEMRTPLTAILGIIETLQGPARDDSKARDKFFGSMLTQARRMKRLVDDLLTLSRIELNEHVRPGARVDLADVARQARSNLLTLAKDVNVELSVSSSEPALVAGDADELLQVAQNLIENALKYGNGGGKVEVTCEKKAGFAVLSVRDWGKGIAAIHLPRLTERFYRVSTQESRARGGTGLGLAIVKHIVSRHRGSLAIESREGQGSTFSVSIPLY